MGVAFGENGQKPLATSDSVYAGMLGGSYAEFGMDGKNLVFSTRVAMKKGIRTHKLTAENIRWLYAGYIKVFWIRGSLLKTISETRFSYSQGIPIFTGRLSWCR